MSDLNKNGSKHCDQSENVSKVHEVTGLRRLIYHYRECIAAFEEALKKEIEARSVFQKRLVNIRRILSGKEGNSVKVTKITKVFNDADKNNSKREEVPSDGSNVSNAKA